MNNLNETVGLRVLAAQPAHKASAVNVNSAVEVEFSADLDRGSLVNNIVVLLDRDKIYKDINSLKDYSKFSTVNGSLSYKDRVAVFVPELPFEVDSCYIIVINDQVTDVTGVKLARKYVSCFYTELVASFPKPEIISPKFGAILNAIPEYTWNNQGADSYSFQVSKANTFELLLVDETVPGIPVEESDVIKYTPDMKLIEGLYHVRIKPENGEWSDVHQFYIKEITDAVVANDDLPEMMHYDEFFDNIEEPLVILGTFPEDGATEVSLKTALFYIIFDGKVAPEDVDFDSCYVYGDNYAEDDENEPIGTVNGAWILVYDYEEDKTYLIFRPIDLEQTYEQEVDNSEEEE